MNKRFARVLAAFGVLIMLTVPCVSLCEQTEAIPTIVTIVVSPEQSAPQRPACFPDPADDYIPLPDTENYAQGKKVTSGAHTDVYVISNVNDGKTDTYWESKGFPAEVIFDLDGVHSISTVSVSLNPSAIWEPRQQEIAVMISLDGVQYTQIAAPGMYQFDAATGNRIRIDFDAVDAAYAKIVFSKNTASRTGGAQAAEIGIY